MYPNKPKLEDYGLTQKMVDDNKNADMKRNEVYYSNIEIDTNSKKYGLTVYVVSFIIGLFIGIYTSNAIVFCVLMGLGALIGVITYASVKSTKLPLPPPSNQAITKKYQQYLQELDAYNKAVENDGLTKSVVNLKKDTQTKTNETPKPAKASISNNIKTTTQKESKTDEFDVGVTIFHKSFGEGEIVKIDKSQHIVTVYFREKLKYVNFDYKIAELKIISKSQNISSPTANDVVKEERTTKNISKTVTTKIESEPIVKRYIKENVSLTERQVKLFDELYEISLKYCVELTISPWRYLVGVGYIGHERLRYWLHTLKGKTYIKFSDTKKDIPFNPDNRKEIIEYTHQVNKYFENELVNEEPLKTNESTSKETIKKIEKQLPKEPVIDIFTEEEDDDEIITSNALNTTNSEIEYDNTIFEIQNTTLVKFHGNENNGQYEIPNGVTIIDNNVFANDKYIWNIDIPKSVTTIRDNAFMNCKHIDNINLPASITYIGKHVFDGCEKLETIICTTKAVEKLLTDVPKKVTVVCLEL